MNPAVYDPVTLAKRWDCHKDTVLALIKKGDLPSFRLGGKLLRIRAEEVERFECRNIPSNDTESSSPSSGSTRAEDAIAIRLERQIAR
jgi:excisionase family DNA binding protein